MEQELNRYRIQNIIACVTQMVSDSIIESDLKKMYLDRLLNLSPQLLESTSDVNLTLTGKDMKYIVCFIANMDVKSISLIFNVEPASVYTVRYRIRKKIAKDDNLQMIF